MPSELLLFTDWCTSTSCNCGSNSSSDQTDGRYLDQLPWSVWWEIHYGPLHALLNMIHWCQPSLYAPTIYNWACSIAARLARLILREAEESGHSTTVQWHDVTSCQASYIVLIIPAVDNLTFNDKTINHRPHKYFLDLDLYAAINDS